MGVLVNVMIEVAMMVKVSCHEGAGVPVGLNGGVLAARNAVGPRRRRGRGEVNMERLTPGVGGGKVAKLAVTMGWLYAGIVIVELVA